MEKFKENPYVLGLSDSEKEKLLVVNLTDHFQLKSIVGNKLKAEWFMIETECKLENSTYHIDRLMFSYEPNSGNSRTVVVWGIDKDEEGIGKNDDDFVVVEQRGGFNG